MRTLALTAGLLALTAAHRAHAFPEMVRHGYANCNTCHVSPTGGGIITEYGRGLSNEVLSTWGSEEEGKMGWGVVTPPEWLALGGEYRGVRIHRDGDVPNPSKNLGITMQADLSAAVTVGSFTVLGSIGREELPVPDTIISREHYVKYQATDELSLRAGKYLHSIGINVPDHIITTKQGLSFGRSLDGESYNLEAAWIGEAWSLVATAVLAREEKYGFRDERGASLVAGTAFGESHKAGWSVYWGKGRGTRGQRVVTGPWAILGFTPRFFLLSELDFQHEDTGTKHTAGLAQYNRLDYELVQGVHLYVTQEYLRADFESDASLDEAYALGVQFFPRPHFELGLQLRSLRPAAGAPFGDTIWLLGHFYL